jgi:methylenetetrahydrofolate reductase (NADPH)
MRVVDRWQKGEDPTLSFELFPARNDKAAGNLEKAIDKLAGLSPDFVSVTFGAGGSTKVGSRELIQQLQARRLQVMAYFAGYGLAPEEIVEVLDQYQALGVENLLVVRGDPPREDEGFSPHPDSFAHASGLLGFVRERYSFCLGAAGYPEGHVEAESLARDLDYVELKVKQGAEFILTNYCYDNRYYFDFVKACRARGIEVPIVPGIMPVYSVKMLKNLARLCGATITEPLREGLAALPEGDTAAVADFGIEFATEQCRELIRAGVPGLHFYTMDRAKSVVEIVSRLREEGLLY